MTQREANMVNQIIAGLRSCQQDSPWFRRSMIQFIMDELDQPLTVKDMAYLAAAILMNQSNKTD